MIVRHISNHELHEAIQSIADRLPAVDHVLGIGRGALVPAGYLSYKLGVPVTCFPTPPSYDLCSLYELQNKTILLIDNIATTGNTLNTIKKDLSSLISAYPSAKQDIPSIERIYTAALFARPTATRIDFVGSHIHQDLRLEFPWEKPERTIQY